MTINHLQQKLLESCLNRKPEMSVEEIYTELKLQRNVAAKAVKYQEECFSRKTFKKSVMTVSNYGATYRTSRNDVINKLKEMDAFFLESLEPHELSMFTKMVFWSLETSVPCAINFLTYFRKLIRFSVKIKGEVRFNNPITGFPVHLRVFKEESTDFAYRANGVRCKLRLKSKTHKVSIPKTTTSSVPSITHSNDAAILVSIKELLGEAPTSFIHDSIGVHPNNIAKAKKSVKDTLKNVANIDVYERIRDDLLEGIDPDIIPEELMTVPHEGTWTTIEDLDVADYSFS